MKRLIGKKKEKMNIPFFFYNKKAKLKYFN